MRIAICDEETRGRERIRTLLDNEFSGAQTSEFDSGTKLIEAVKGGYQPDIVLLDIAMEGMNGMETAKKLRALSDVILIFVTGIKGQVFQAFDVGAFHYLMKPVDQEEGIFGIQIFYSFLRENQTPWTFTANWKMHSMGGSLKYGARSQKHRFPSLTAFFSRPPACQSVKKKIT